MISPTLTDAPPAAAGWTPGTPSGDPGPDAMGAPGPDGSADIGRRRRILLVSALPLVLGAAQVAQSAGVGRPGGGGEPVPLAYLPGLFFPWMLYGLLAPAVYLLVERAPLVREEWVRRGPLHVGAALLFAVVHLALSTTLHLAVYRPSDLTWGGFYRSNLTGFLMSDVAQYVLLAVASHALLFHGKLRERELTTLRLEAHLAEARLQALTRQVSPHFLFNALNTVAALARRGDTDAVRDVVSDLADLLRLSLGESEGQLVPVARELERLERYVAIQRVRYGARLQVRLRLTPEIREARVPTMALQPLVENSIKHGLARPGAGLRVEVALSGDDSTVEITVDDDGPGFPASPAEVRPGVGLGNLRSRLQALYGPGHVFELGRSPLGGARVRLRIPGEASPGAGPPADASGETP